MLYPLNNEAGYKSDRERFASLESQTPVYRFDEIANVDWNPAPADVEHLKLQMLDRFYVLTASWPRPDTPGLGPIAPPSQLPPP